MLGFLAVNAILGGQTLSLASGSGMSYDVGIVVVGVISLMVSTPGIPFTSVAEANLIVFGLYSFRSSV